MIPANRINLDGDALLVGSDDANDVRHETLSHRGPHQAIAVAHLVLRNLVDKVPSHYQKVNGLNLSLIHI